MKTFLLVLCLTTLVSCKNNTDTKVMDEDTDRLSMKGAWKLISYYNYKDNAIIDTIRASDEYKQIKLFTDTKVMWSRYKDTDTVDWFGYGDYSVGKDSLVEVLDFGSKSMNEAIKEQKKFVFKLTLDRDKFTQVQMDDEGNSLYAENYVKIE